jgi:ADP-heptose:LPS heptosyltransferase
VAAKKFIARLRAASYDLALVMSTVAFSCTSAWLAVLSGAHRRAGRPGPDGRGEEIARDVYHWVLPAPLAGRHQSAANLDLVAPFGASGEDWRPELSLSFAERQDGEKLLACPLGEAGGEGLRVVVHPGAGKRPNRWPAERFGALVAALRAAGHRVAVAVGPREEELLAALDRGAGQPVARLARAPVRVLAGAIAAADLLLANDTGILHVGAAVGVPVLAFFGPTDPAQWCPAAPRVWALRAPAGDLALLSEQEVVPVALQVAAHLARGDGLPAGLTGVPAGVP